MLPAAGRAGARQPEADRQIAAAIGEFVAHDRNQPFELVCAKRQAFARGGSEDQSVERTVCVVADQLPQRGLV